MSRKIGSTSAPGDAFAYPGTAHIASYFSRSRVSRLDIVAIPENDFPERHSAARGRQVRGEHGGQGGGVRDVPFRVKRRRGALHEVSNRPAFVGPRLKTVFC